jgi:hypothetical protein
MNTDGSVQFWVHLPNGALSVDGTWEVAGFDRHAYYLRYQGETALIPCEMYNDTNGRAAAAFSVDTGIEVSSAGGMRHLRSDEVPVVKDILRTALPLIGVPSVQFD